MDSKLPRKPKSLFLIDSIGAFISAIFLIVIMSTFSQYFGMPKIILAYLAAIAVIFCLYSMICFLMLKDKWKPFLRAIAIANFLYGCLTIGLILSNFSNLTLLGIIYFSAELIIVYSLVFIELKTLKNYA